MGAHPWPRWTSARPEPQNGDGIECQFIHRAFQTPIDSQAIFTILPANIVGYARKGARPIELRRDGIGAFEARFLAQDHPGDPRELVRQSHGHCVAMNASLDRGPGDSPLNKLPSVGGQSRLDENVVDAFGRQE